MVYTFLFRADPEGGFALAFEQSQQSLRLKPESVGNAIESREQRCDMDSLGNLQLAPARIVQQVHIGLIDLVRTAIHLSHKA